MEFKDYYKILGVSKTASAAEIKTAFRNLTKKYHPDVNNTDPKAEEKFKDVNEAYQVLSDPEKRQKYDTLGVNWNTHRGSGGTQDNFNWEQWFSQSRGTRERRSTGNPLGDMFGGGLSDFFEKIFGGGSGFSKEKTYTGQTKPKVMETSIELTLEEAFKGTSRKLSINNRTINVKFKRGIADGQTLRISNIGATESNSSMNGDLIIKVQVKDSERIRRKGNDLYVKVDLDLFNFLLGGNATINTFAGKIKFNIPAGSQNGKILKIPKMGMPIYDTNDEMGDLYLELIVKLPQNLSEEEKELLNNWKKISEN
ncbi:MAG: hypothetical protein A2X64_08915 [Ignavibacteria bacterium GWF2_33_9]|nr:MAG: hypothetical protein A2X64_08915 [Ignavibacteria bacterium GWF2_33_9]